jgi:hypothetical protein
MKQNKKAASISKGQFNLRTDEENEELRKIGEQIKRRLIRIFEAEVTRRHCNHASRRKTA